METITIDTKLRELSYWEEVLGKSRYDDLCECLRGEYGTDFIKYSYTAREVFCYIIEYEGGCYGNFALNLINQLMGIKIN